MLVFGLSASSFPADRSKVFPLLQFFFVCASVVSYVTCVLSFFVPYLSFFWYLERAVLRDCGIPWVSITTTRLYNFDPFKPHFYIVKLGFTGVYISFLISALKHRLWVPVRTASPRRFKRVPTIYI